VDLKTIPGACGPAQVRQVEQFTELDLSPEQYIAYATVVVQLLQGRPNKEADPSQYFRRSYKSLF
jgi:hypothetical protein